ncbi:choline/carnitine O-acyltransferase [Campylobacter hepaticus]
MMKLPIPSLKTTKANFIKHALAYPSFDKNLIDRFFDNSAIKLQKLLQNYDLHMNSSYLERNWTKSYLKTREPLSIASNFCFKLPKQYDLNDFIYTFAKLIKAYDNNELEFITSRGNKLFKRQFEILKDGCRVPKSTCDEFNLSFKNTNYISILHNNNLYKADVLSTLSGIKMEFKKEKRDISFAHLSFCNSDEAARLYDQYEEYNVFFNTIENSRFNISIINKEFNNFDKEQHYMLYLAPIYHYKTLNFIYNESTKNIYVNTEHSFLDGGTIAFILE